MGEIISQGKYLPLSFNVNKGVSVASHNAALPNYCSRKAQGKTTNPDSLNTLTQMHILNAHYIWRKQTLKKNNEVLQRNPPTQIVTLEMRRVIHKAVGN